MAALSLISYIVIMLALFQLIPVTLTAQGRRPTPPPVEGEIDIHVDRLHSAADHRCELPRLRLFQQQARQPISSGQKGFTASRLRRRKVFGLGKLQRGPFPKCSSWLVPSPSWGEGTSHVDFAGFSPPNHNRTGRVISEPRQVIWAFDQDAWARGLGSASG